MDCCPTCLRMVAKHYGRSVGLEKLRKLSETTREGSSLKNIADSAEKIGFRTLGVKIDLNKLVQDAPLPCVLHWNQNHYIVVYKIKKDTIWIADPGYGLIKLNKQEFLKNWIGENATETTEEGIALLLEPTPKLKQAEDDDIAAKQGFRCNGSVDGECTLDSYLYIKNKNISYIYIFSCLRTRLPFRHFSCNSFYFIIN